MVIIVIKQKLLDKLLKPIFGNLWQFLTVLLIIVVADFYLKFSNMTIQEIWKMIFHFYKKMDTLSNRKVDNANFFAVDKNISLSDEELFDKLVEELGSWKQECKKLGILK